jgi:hypothetical protein
MLGIPAASAHVVWWPSLLGLVWGFFGGTCPLEFEFSTQEWYSHFTKFIMRVYNIWVCVVWFEKNKWV